MRNGDLTESFFRRPDGSLIPIMDLSNGAPFPNNQIPASRLSPQAKALMEYWPAPNTGTSEFTGTNNYTGFTRNADDDYQFFVTVPNTCWVSRSRSRNGSVRINICSTS